MNLGSFGIAEAPEVHERNLELVFFFRAALSQWLQVPRENPMRMAGATGLELAASCVTGRRFNQLDYARALKVQLLIIYYRLFPSVPVHSHKFLKAP